jgi:bacillithiol system protein YtxJ
MVMRQCEFAYGVDIKADLYYLDLLSYRDVSVKVDPKFQVMHQSPQLLVLRNGVMVDHDSYGAINQMDLIRFL